MYNLLVTSGEGTWDGDDYIFDISRFLKFTSDALVSRLKPATNESRDLLLTLPTLFAYESELGCDARVGWLRTIHRRETRIRITFRFDEALAPIPAARIRALAWDLETEGWEMTTTHWAVKEPDLFAVLNGQCDPGQNVRPPYAATDSAMVGRRSVFDPDQLLLRVLRPQASSLASTAGFRAKRHDPMLETLRSLLEERLEDDPRITILQSLQDRGCDLLIEWTQRAKYGVQLKSNGDVENSDFAVNVLAQIQDSRQHGLERLYLVLAADMTTSSNLQKVRGLMSRISSMNDPYVVVISPENAWGALFPVAEAK